MLSVVKESLEAASRVGAFSLAGVGSSIESPPNNKLPQDNRPAEGINKKEKERKKSEVQLW